MKKLLLCAASLCLYVSCAPPFNLDYSTSAIILGKLTREYTIGPIYNYYSGYYATNPAFLPEKTAAGVDSSRGIFITTDIGGSAEILGFIQPGGSGGYSSASTPIGIFYGQDPSYPRFAVAPVKTGDAVLIVDLDSTNLSSRGLAVEQLTVTSGSLTLTATYSSSFSTYVGYGSPPEALGASVFPSMASSDTFSFLMRDTATGQLHDGTATLDSTGVAGFGDVFGAETLDFIPPGISRVMYYHDPVSNASYASFFSGGAWQCWKWSWNASILTRVQLTGVTSRIDALLTTGELFSAQGGVGRVYDSDGNLRTKFPLGSLQFAYEEYINGAPRVFFSMPIIQDDNQLSFTVYSIASADLHTLTY